MYSIIRGLIRFYLIFCLRWVIVRYADSDVWEKLAGELPTWPGENGMTPEEIAQFDADFLARTGKTFEERDREIVEELRRLHDQAKGE